MFDHLPNLLSLHTTVLLTIIITLCYLLYRSLLPKPIPGIPYHADSARRILGDTPRLLSFMAQRSDVWAFDAFQIAELGAPVVQILLPFQRPIVVCADSREAMDIVLRRTREIDRGSSFSDLFSGTVPTATINMPSHDAFRAKRKLFAETMSSGFLNDVVAVQLYAAAKDLTRLWGDKARLARGGPWECQEDLSYTVLDAVYASLFGHFAGCTRAQAAFLEGNDTENKMSMSGENGVVVFKHAPHLPLFDAITEIVNGIMKAGYSPFPVQTHFFVRLTSKWRKAKKLTDTSIKEAIAASRSRLAGQSEAKVDSGEGFTCALDLAMKRLHAAEEKGQNGPTDAELIDELLSFLIGGHDTTGAALGFAVKYLAANPGVQQKAREELKKALGGSIRNSGDDAAAARAVAKANLPYFDAVLEEILRLGRIGAGISREAMVDTDILGYRIPAGTRLVLASGTYDQKFPWPSNVPIAESVRSESSRSHKDRAPPPWDVATIGDFIPERWLKAEKDEQTGGEKMVFDSQAGPSMPFSAGVRGCFGKRMAYLSLRVILTAILLNLELEELPEGLNSTEGKQGFTMVAAQPYVRLKALGV